MFSRERLKRWTDALRANPELQISGRLFAGPPEAPTGFCCLGMLCKIEGLEFLPEGSVRFGEMSDGAILRMPLREEFGDIVGTFNRLLMPNLGKHPSAAHANDAGVSWPVIADHFDRYYPCSPENV